MYHSITEHPDWQTLHRRLKESLTNKQASINLYIGNINQYIRHAQHWPEDATEESIHGFREYLKQKNLKGSTINNYLRTIKKHYKIISLDLWNKENTELRLSLTPIRYLEDDEPEIFLFNESPKYNDFNPHDFFKSRRHRKYALRDFFTIIYMRYLGTSKVETRDALTTDLDFKRGLARVTRSKVNLTWKKQMYPLEGDDYSLWPEYLIFWSGMQYYVGNKIESDYLFPNKSGRRLSSRSVDHGNRELCKALFGENLGCHIWKKTRATEFIMKVKGNWVFVHRFFKWSDPKLMNHYLNVYTDLEEIQDPSWILAVYDVLGIDTSLMRKLYGLDGGGDVGVV